MQAPASSNSSITLSVSILRSLEVVYGYASDPGNLPQWAPGLCQNIRQEGGEWCIDSPMGVVRLKFTPTNAFGILDHWVVPAPDVEIYVPMRVIANPESGSTVLFTLFRLPGMSDAEFAADQKMVQADLVRLKQVAEGLP